MAGWGVALSGGGAPGIAGHLGFLQALQGWGLKPDVVVGASAGGIVAGMLAAGATVEQQIAAWREIAKDAWSIIIPGEILHAVESLRPSTAPGLLNLHDVVQDVWHSVWPFPGSRMLGATELWAEAEMARGHVAGWLPGHGVVVSDLTDGKAVVLRHGAPAAAEWMTTSALTATAAFPPVLAGVRGPDGHLYVDGGLYADLPVQAVRDLGADKVLAVRIGSPAAVPDRLSLECLLQIVIGRLLDAADSHVAPAELTVDIATAGGLLSLHAWEQDMEAGATAAAAHRSAIEALAGVAVA